MDLPSLLPQVTLFPSMVPCLVPELPAPWHSWHMPDPGFFHSSHDPWSRLGSNREIFCEKATRFNVREAELYCYKYREVSYEKQYEARSISARVGVSSNEGVKMRRTSSRDKYIKAQEATKLYRRRSRSLPSETDIFDLYHEDDKNHKIEHTEPVTQMETQMETQLPETKVSPDLLSEAMSKATDEGYNSYKKAFRINTQKLDVSPEISKRSPPRVTNSTKKPASLKRSISLPTDQELIKTQDQLMISSSPSMNPHSADHNEQLLSDYLKNWKEDFQLNREMIDLNSRNSASDDIDFSDSCSDSDSTISSVGGEPLFVFYHETMHNRHPLHHAK